MHLVGFIIKIYCEVFEILFPKVLGHLKTNCGCIFNIGRHVYLPYAPYILTVVINLGFLSWFTWE